MPLWMVVWGARGEPISRAGHLGSDHVGELVGACRRQSARMIGQRASDSRPLHHSLYYYPAVPNMPLLCFTLDEFLLRPEQSVALYTFILGLSLGLVFALFYTSTFPSLTTLASDLPRRCKLPNSLSAQPGMVKSWLLLVSTGRLRD